MPSDQVSSSTVNLDYGEGHSAEEPKSAGLGVADMLDERVVPLLKYLDRKMAKYAEPTIAGSYVELVGRRVRTKKTTSVEVAESVASLTSKCATVKTTLREREKRLRQTELECAELQRSLAVEKNLHTKAKLEYAGFGVDISNAQKVTVELRHKVEVFRMGFERHLKRAEELTATLTTCDQLRATELVLKTKEFEDCEAARSSKLERREILDADCSKL